MEKKWSISFILACLLTLFVIKPQSVAAKELSPFQTKMIGNGNFGIYQSSLFGKVISGFTKDLHVEDLHVGSVQRELSGTATSKPVLMLLLK